MGWRRGRGFFCDRPSSSERAAATQKGSGGMMNQITRDFLIAGLAKAGVVELFVIYQEGMARPGGFEPPTL